MMVKGVKKREAERKEKFRRILGMQFLLLSISMCRSSVSLWRKERRQLWQNKCRNPSSSSCPLSPPWNVLPSNATADPAASRELSQVKWGHVFFSVPLRRKRSLARRVHNLTNPEVIRWELTIGFWQLGAQKRVRKCQKIALVLATSLLPKNWKQNTWFTEAFNRASVISFTWILMLLKLCSTWRRALYLRKISCWGYNESKQCWTACGVVEAQVNGLKINPIAIYDRNVIWS